MLFLTEKYFFPRICFAEQEFMHFYAYNWVQKTNENWFRSMKLKHENSLIWSEYFKGLVIRTVFRVIFNKSIQKLVQAIKYLLIYITGYKNNLAVILCNFHFLF